MQLRTLSSAIFSVIGLAIPGPAHAQVLFFTDRAAWQAAVGTAPTIEDFSSFAADTPFQTAPVALNGMTIQQLGFNAAFRNLVDVPPLQFAPNSGSSSGSLYTNFAEGATPATQVGITFAQSNRAFGLDSWGAFDGEGSVLEVFNGATLLGSQNLTNGNGDFIGYIVTGGGSATSARFSSVNLNPGGGGEGFYIDNLAVVPVPEPSGLVLLGLGLLGFARRRRRNGNGAAMQSP